LKRDLQALGNQGYLDLATRAGAYFYKLGLQAAAANDHVEDGVVTSSDDPRKSARHC